MNTGTLLGTGHRPISAAVPARGVIGGPWSVSTNPAGFTSTPADIAGLTGDVYVRKRYLLAIFTAATSVIDSGTGARCAVTLNEGAALLDRFETPAFSTVVVAGGIVIIRPLLLSPGRHTLKMQGLTNTGTAHLVASVDYPVSLTILEV